MFWKWVANIVDDLKPLLEAVNAILEATGKKTINLDFASNRANELSEKIGFVSVGDAYSEGYAKGAVVGQNIQNSINEFGEKLKKGINGFGESFGEGNGFGEGFEELLGLTPLPTDDITPNLEDIKDNTGKMADSMELTAEDMEYLRKVANMEWKKEFTTATITVDMTNNNTISNDFDLKSLATGLRDMLEEEMYYMADGVYV